MKQLVKHQTPGSFLESFSVEKAHWKIVFPNNFGALTLQDLCITVLALSAILLKFTSNYTSKTEKS